MVRSFQYQSVWVGLVLMLLQPSWLQAQQCSGYEREMQEIFMDYLPGQQLDIRKIDLLYARCYQPSDKMSLIYHYFKSVDAWFNPNLSDEAAVQDARYQYEQAARFFPFLVEAGESDAEFVDLFFQQASDLQDQLGIDYLVLEDTQRGETYRTRGMNQTNNQSDWEKYTPPQKQAGYRTTNIEKEDPDFKKNTLRSGQYQSADEMVNFPH